MPLWMNKTEVLGTFSEVRHKRWERSKWERWVARWEGELTRIQTLPLALRTAAVIALLIEIDSAFWSAPVAAIPALAPNDPNPAKTGVFDGDGHILLNMVLYAGAGFIISLILKYMGRGELSMIVLMITGFVILRQVIYVLKELLKDVTDLINL